jgi:hypothetical protein
VLRPPIDTTGVTGHVGQQYQYLLRERKLASSSRFPIVMHKQLIASHPILFGVFISVLLGIAIIATMTWIPWIWEYHNGHKRLVQAVFFTVFYFAYYISFLWEQRHQTFFWPSVCTVFLLHGLGVYFYSTRVQPILVWQWPMIALLEFYGTAFFLEWSTRRFASHPRKSKPGNRTYSYWKRAWTFHSRSFRSFSYTVVETVPTTRGRFSSFDFSSGDASNCINP